MNQQKGFTLVEMMISLAVLGVILASVSSAYLTQVKQSTQEYKVAQVELELGIAKNLIERDLAMAGYGLADDYSAPSTPAFTVPRAIDATNSSTAPDTLILRGTALGIESKGTQNWSYIQSVTPGAPNTMAFNIWSDSREDLVTNGKVFLVDPATKKLLTEPTSQTWLFTYQGNNLNFSPTLVAPLTGTLVYAAATGATRPYATVLYSLANVSSPSNCAPGTFSLMRSELWTADPAAGTGNPLLACVLDLQVAFGLDTAATPTGDIALWDNGGVTAQGYDPVQLKKRVRQIRFYLLIQTENLDSKYTYPSNPITVGDTLLGIGRNVTLTAAQLNYRWKVLSFVVTPRNMR